MRCGKRRCLLTMLFVGVVVAVLIFVVIPLAIYSSSALQSFFIFARFGERILTPEEVGLNATRNFYLAYNDEEFCQPQLCTDVLRREIVLGVWHVLPQSYAESYIKVKDNSTELAEAIHDLLATEVKQFSTIKSTAAEAAEDCDARVRSFDITDWYVLLMLLKISIFDYIYNNCLMFSIFGRKLELGNHTHIYIYTYTYRVTHININTYICILICNSYIYTHISLYIYVFFQLLLRI